MVKRFMDCNKLLINVPVKLALEEFKNSQVNSAKNIDVVMDEVVLIVDKI